MADFRDNSVEIEVDYEEQAGKRKRLTKAAGSITL